MPKMTKDIWKQRLIDLKRSDKDDYIFLEEFKGFDIPIKYKHLKCGKIIEKGIAPHYFLGGRGCPECANNHKRTIEGFKEEVRLKFGDRYTILTEKYETNLSPIQVQCNNCNNTFKAYPVKLLAGRSCPYCCNRNNSLGRKTIENYLLDKKIEFIPEYSFENCKGQSNKRNLLFDFYIPEKNLIIEYDGEFHYINKMENQRFNEQQANDKIKDEYCRINNINLLRIPYWYLNKITSTLHKFLKDEKIYIPLQESINTEIKNFKLND